jgi:hypothetical protein
MIAGLEPLHAPADRLHHPHPLVPQHQRLAPFSSQKSMSVRQMPEATRRTKTSSSRGPSISRDSICWGPPFRRRTAAWIWCS